MSDTPRSDLEARLEESERALAEARHELQALRRNALFLESIVENIPDMVFVKDADELRFVRFNRAGEELLGYARTDLMGKNDYDFFPRDEADFFTSKDREVLAGTEFLDIPEEPIHTRAQALRWLHTKKIPIRDKDGKTLYLLGISEDITEAKAAAEQLAQRTRELERSNADLEQFAYVASHDLQEPLRMIGSYLQPLEQRYGDRLDDDARVFIGFAVDGAARLQKMINDLLAYAQVRREARPFEAVALDRALAQALTNLKIAVEEASAEVTHGPLPVIAGDEPQLVQLFQNLIGNAIKFQREMPRIRVEAASSGAEWVVSVADNGIGISPEYYERIFGMFVRLHNRARYVGNGVGLALCKRIVERHDGRIWVESTPGEGSTFFIAFPSRPDAA